MATEMTKTVTAVRSLLLDFLRTRRTDIEDMVVQEHGISIAKAYLWRDVREEDSSEHQQMSFKELCESISKCGTGGHWLGAGIGETEVHLLGRALGVSVHCVMAAKEIHGSYFLRQTFRPNPVFWKGKLQGTCAGAVVLRFVGNYSSGHCQHVRCGYFPRDNTITNENHPRVVGTVADKSLRTRNKSANMKHHMQAIYKMHGVQAMTKKRYSKDYGLISNAFRALKEKGTDPLNLGKNGAAVVEAVMALLLQRCGPVRYGYEGLSAKATGRVLLAAVATWYKDNGKSFNDTHSCVVSGNAVSGPPWKAQQLLEFKESLDKAQSKAKAVSTRRAYQITHDDLGTVMRRYVASQLGRALDTRYEPGSNPDVNWLHLQTALMVSAAFGSGCRGAKIVNIKLGDLLFLKDATDTDVLATLYGVKAKRGCRAIRRVLFPTWSETAVISPAFAILTQLALVHGSKISMIPHKGGSTTLSQLPLFPNIHRNQVQKGQLMGSDTYSGAVKEIFREAGITENATEHSPRRGGAGFRYYVLRETLDYIRDFLGHSSISETLLYIGFHNKDNSYVLQGYGSCGSRSLR